MNIVGVSIISLLLSLLVKDFFKNQSALSKFQARRLLSDALCAWAGTVLLIHEDLARDLESSEKWLLLC